MKFALLTLLILSCSKPKEPNAPIASTPEINELFEQAQNRLVNHFLVNGQVVSRSNEGPEHLGDSLIWSGLFLGAASCEAGKATEETLQNTIKSLNGALIRFNPLPDSYIGNEASLDGALGLYRGIAERVKRCPESRQSWLDVLKLHKQYIEANNGRFNASSPSQLVPNFDLVLGRLMASLNDSRLNYRFDSRLDAFLFQCTSWAAAVMASHSAAFRIHLTFLALQTLEISGSNIPSNGRASYCEATKGVDMPTLDAWCGRGDLKKWVYEFEFNRWEYRHQRSGKWESPDAGRFSSPGLDLLVGIRQAYTLKEGL